MSDRIKREPLGVYDVGYCRPPKETRWKKGESGNPSRRRKRKGSKQEVARILAKALEKEVKVTEDGKRVRRTLKELLVHKLISDMLTGTPAHRARLFKDLNAMGALTPDPASYGFETEDLNTFFRGIAAGAGLEPDGEGGYREPEQKTGSVDS